MLTVVCVLAVSATFTLSCADASGKVHPPIYLSYGNDVVSFIERQVLLGNLDHAWTIDRTPDVASVLGHLDALNRLVIGNPATLSAYDTRMLASFTAEFSRFRILETAENKGLRQRPFIVISPGDIVDAAIDPLFRLAWFPSGYPDLESTRDGALYTIGASIFGSVGTSVGFQLMVSDTRYWNQEEEIPYIFQPEEAVPRAWNNNESRGSFDYDQADAILSARWREFTFGMGKVKLVRGFSAENFVTRGQHAPSFPHLTVTWDPESWLRLSWFHGYLESAVPDTLEDGGALWPRVSNYPKQLVCHRLDLRPAPWLELSAGESVIYARRNFEALYWIPIMFYWSAEHYLGDLDNIQIFFDAAVRPLRGHRLYGSLFIDEFSIERCFDKEEHHNWVGFQAGWLFTPSGWRIPPSIRLEYTRITPGAYQHKWAESDYSSHGLPLGFWGGRNSDNLSLDIGWALPEGITIGLHTSIFRKGEEMPPDSLYGEGLASRTFLEGEQAERRTAGLDVKVRRISGLEFACEIGYVSWNNLKGIGVEVEDFSKVYTWMECSFRFR